MILKKCLSLHLSFNKIKLAMKSLKQINLNNMLCRGVLSDLDCKFGELRTPYIAVLNELSVGDYIDHIQKQSGGYSFLRSMRATSVELDDPKLHHLRITVVLPERSDEKCVQEVLARLSKRQVQGHHA